MTTEKADANGHETSTAPRTVLSALDTLTPKLDERATALFSPYLRKGEKMPDFALVATLVRRLLDDRAEAMKAADSKHTDELADDAAPRESRDAAQRDLYAALVDIKQGVTALFGQTWHSALKIPNEIPQDPTQLQRLASEVEQAIRGAKLPKPKLKGMKSFDVEPWLKQIGEVAEQLGKALSDIAREGREAQATLIVKNRAVAAYDEAFSGGVTLVAALLRIVGEHERADRLRPSPRKPGTLDTPASESPDEPTQPA